MLKKVDKKMLAIFSLVVVAFFGIFVKMNYSVDTYLLFASRGLSYIQEYIKSGRFFTALLFKFLQIFKATPTIMYTISFVIGIINTILAIFILYEVLKKYISNNICCSIIAISIIINPYIIELWLFVEMGIMMLSILASVLAFKYFDDFISDYKKKNLYMSVLFMIIAMFSYQGTVALFIALSTISVLIHSDGFKKIIKNMFWCFVCYGIPTLINFVIVMLIGNKRMGLESSIMQKIQFIAFSTKDFLLKGFGLYPVALFTLIHILAIAVVVYLAIKSEKKGKNILGIMFIIVMDYLFTIATIIPMDIKSAVMFPRNSYAFGSIIGLLGATAIMLGFSNEKNTKVFCGICIVMLAMELVQFNIIATDRYVVNYIDKYILLEIDKKITDYEQKTGIKVTNMAIYNEENAKLFYKGLEDNINVSALKEEMSRKAIFALYARRQFKEVNKDDSIYRAYFKGNDWDEFDLEQVVIEGDTLHWYMY